MRRALDLAREAMDAGEVPVGAVITSGDDEIIAEARNAMRGASDPTAHAEIVAIRAACEELGQERLTGADLYVTLEPCTMCAAAISFARIRRLYYGAHDPKGGAVESGVQFYAQPTCHHVPDVYAGLSERASAEILTDFFRAKRD